MMNSSKAFKETKLDHRLTGASNIDEQLQDVLKYVFRDYIEIWHKEISEDGEFLVELRKIFNAAISNFASRSVFFLYPTFGGVVSGPSRGFRVLRK